MGRKLTTLVLAMGLLASACGDDDEPGAGSETTSAAETTLAADAADTTDTTVAPESTAVETTTGGDAGGVTLDDSGRLVPAECTGDDNVANEDEGVTADSVNLATINVDLGPIADLGFSASGVDLGHLTSVYVDAANAAGGVCGRRIDLEQTKYDILGGAGPMGEACVQVTQDRTNLAALATAYQDPLCVTDAGVALFDAYDVFESEMEVAGGLLVGRKPSVEDQYRATAQYALDSGALDGKVGVFYGDGRTEFADIAEEFVLPMLDEAEVDYTAVRTDFPGPYVSEGNAVLTAAATDFVSHGVDTVLLFVSNMNLTGIQLELSAQGLNPRYISMPIAENTANDLFAESYGTKEISDGMEYLTYTYSPREVGENDLAAKSCNAQWTELTGETVEPNTYDYYLVAITCVIVDEVLAALSLAGGDLNREAFISGI